MFNKPKKSPWGEIKACDTLCPGVFMVTAPDHGGTMVSKDIAAFLSPAAKKCGFRQDGFICFEENTQENVALRELLDKKLWAIPDRVRDKAAFEENINKSLREHNPDYWRARQAGLEHAAARHSVPVRHTAPPVHSAER